MYAQSLCQCCHGVGSTLTSVEMNRTYLDLGFLVLYTLGTWQAVMRPHDRTKGPYPIQKKYPTSATAIPNMIVLAKKGHGTIISPTNKSILEYSSYSAMKLFTRSGSLLR